MSTHDASSVPTPSGSLATPATPTAVAVPLLPPQPGAPTTPAAFVPLDRKRARALLKAVPVQVAAASTVAVEIASARYEDDFKGYAPPAEELGQLIAAADAWDREARKAQAWHQFASAQRQLAWDALLRRVAPLQKLYAFALDHDGTIAARYPALTHFVRAKRTVALHAWRTKRAKRAEGQAEASAAREVV